MCSLFCVRTNYVLYFSLVPKIKDDAMMNYNVLKNTPEHLTADLSQLDMGSYRRAEYRTLAENIKKRFPDVEVIVIHAQVLVLRIPDSLVHAVRDEFNCDVTPRI